MEQYAAGSYFILRGRNIGYDISLVDSAALQPSKIAQRLKQRSLSSLLHTVQYSDGPVDLVKSLPMPLLRSTVFSLFIVSLFSCLPDRQCIRLTKDGLEEGRGMDGERCSFVFVTTVEI